MPTKQGQHAGLLTSFPSLLLVLVVPIALVGFPARIPLALAAGGFGLVCSMHARRFSGVRLLMLAVNVGAAPLANSGGVGGGIGRGVGSDAALPDRNSSQTVPVC